MFLFPCRKPHPERWNQFPHQMYHYWKVLPLYGKINIKTHFINTVLLSLQSSNFLPSDKKPSWEQTTLASTIPHESSQTVPHSFSMQISTLPSVLTPPPTSCSSPFVQVTKADKFKDHSVEHPGSCRCAWMNKAYVYKQRQHPRSGRNCEFQLAHSGMTAEQPLIPCSWHHPEKWIPSLHQREHCHVPWLL